MTPRMTTSAVTQVTKQCNICLCYHCSGVSAGHTIKDSMNNLAHNIPEPLSQVLQPITAALHPTTVVQAPAPAGADTEVHVDEVDPVCSFPFACVCASPAVDM